MSNLNALLHAAGFSKKFCKNLAKRHDIFGEEKSHRLGYHVIVEDANLLRFVLEDFRKHTKDLQTLCYTRLSLDVIQEDEVIRDDKDRKTAVVGPGIHIHKDYNIFFCYENAEIETTMLTGSSKYVNRAAIASLESLEVIIEYLKTLEKKNENEEKLKLYIASDGNWHLEKIDKRTSQTLFLPLWNDIYEDAKDFWSDKSKQWFKKHCVPYSRTYIFKGHAGTGKSSCIRTLASELEADLYTLQLTHARMDDQVLIDLIREVDSPRSIVAIEDIDRIFDHHSANQTASSVSFATLLNVLDGLLTKENVIIILTCNNYEQLDDALKRCGRVDRVYEFPHASKSVMKDMFLSYYPEQKKEMKVFLNKIHGVSNIPVATVQEFFIRNRKRTASEAVSEMDVSFFKRRRTLEDRPMFM